MRIEFIAQPDLSFGGVLFEELATHGTPRRLIVVSAFASWAAAIRFKDYLIRVHAEGGDARLVLGVDLGGTSREVLREVSEWGVPVMVVKNRAGGVTFHPKLYHVEWASQAQLFVGSNNLTDGGLFRNYEAAARVTFALPADAAEHARAQRELARFLSPAGATARSLDTAYLETLLRVPAIPSESDARQRRQDAVKSAPADPLLYAAFGFEPAPTAPKLPPELQAKAIALRQRQRAEVRRQIREIRRTPVTTDADEPQVVEMPPPEVQFDPEAFFMTLPKLSNAKGNTPGEVRVPLEALELAQDFWGWPYNYGVVISPRGGNQRVYREWRSAWRIYLAANPAAAQVTPNVRLYYYENSSDFRFYARRVVTLGANSDDVVRIRRVDEPDVTFDCAVALNGSQQWQEWRALCVNVARGGRRFGFA